MATPVGRTGVSLLVNGILAPRFVQPPFSLNLRPEVSEAVFLRLDDHLRLAITQLAGERSTEEKKLLRVFFEWALANFDADAYAVLQNRYIDAARRGDAGAVQVKYLNLPYYARNKMKQLYRLGLHQGPTKRILDVGCGPGHIHLLARHFGHEVLGVDLPLPKSHIFNELCSLFHAPKVDCRIEAMTLLPKFSHRFDLVTIFLANFNLDANGPWGEPEWRFFVNDVCENILAPNGAIYVTLTGTRRWTKDGWDYLSSVAEWTRNDRFAFITRDRKSSRQTLWRRSPWSGLRRYLR